MDVTSGVVADAFLFSSSSVKFLTFSLTSCERNDSSFAKSPATLLISESRRILRAAIFQASFKIPVRPSFLFLCSGTPGQPCAIYIGLFRRFHREFIGGFIKSFFFQHCWLGNSFGCGLGHGDLAVRIIFRFVLPRGRFASSRHDSIDRAGQMPAIGDLSRLMLVKTTRIGSYGRDGAFGRSFSALCTSAIARLEIAVARIRPCPAQAAPRNLSVLRPARI